MFSGRVFGNGMISMHVSRNLLKKNSSTLGKEVSFPLRKAVTVRSILSSSPFATTSVAVLAGISVNCHWPGIFAKHASYCTSNSALQIKERRNRLKVLSKKFKILGLEYLVDCSQTKDDDQQPGGSQGLEVARDCRKPKKKWKTRRNDGANW